MAREAECPSDTGRSRWYWYCNTGGTGGTGGTVYLTLDSRTVEIAHVDLCGFHLLNATPQPIFPHNFRRPFSCAASAST